MGIGLFLLFAALSFSAVSFSLKNDRLRSAISAVQIFSVLGGLVFFSYLFITQSLEPKSGNGISIQIINELPQTIDFYLLQKQKIKKDIEVSHLGTIRTDYYRLEHLNLRSADSFQILGMLGKNTVYLSQHQIPNQNVDQIISVKNYSIDSDRLAEDSQKQIANYNAGVRNTAIWMAMDLLLLFLNTMLLWKKHRHRILNV